MNITVRKVAFNELEFYFLDLQEPIYLQTRRDYSTSKSQEVYKF